MISLDMHTLLFSFIITNIIITFLMLMMWLQTRSRFKGTIYLVLDFAFQTTALIMIALRGNIPDWISIIVSNSLVIAGAIAGLVGLEKFLGIKGKHIHNLIILVIFVIIHTIFTSFYPDLAARNLNFSVTLLTITSQCFWLLFYKVKGENRKLTFSVGMIFLLYSIVNTLRVVNFLIFGNTGNDYFKPDHFEAFVLISYQVLFILLTYNLSLMFSRQLQMDILIEKEKFSKAFHSSPYAIMLTRLADGNIFEVNEGFINITGYKYSDVLEKNTIDLNLWDREEDRRLFTEKLALTGKVHELEFYFRKKSGDLVIGLVSAEMLTINNEKCIIASINDITERKLAADAFRNLSLRNEAILGSVPNIIMEVDNQKIYTWANNSGIEFFGDDVIGKEASYYFEGEQETYKTISSLFVGESELIYLESLQRRKDGETCLLAWWCKVLKDEMGAVTGALLSAADITEQRLAEIKIRESEAKFRNLFENSPLGKSMTGVDGSLNVNRSFCNMLGYTEEELKSRHWKEISHPDDIQVTDEIVKSLIEGKTQQERFEKRYIHKSGKIIWTEVLTYLHRDSDNKPLFFITTINDITERKKLEREQFKLLDIIDSSINEIYMFDSESLKFDYANHGALSNIGYSLSEMRAMTPVDIKPQYSETTFRKAVNPLHKGEKNLLIFETIHKRKNGTEYPVEVHLQLYRRDGSSLFFAVINDITERKKSEQALVHSHELMRYVIEHNQSAVAIHDKEMRYIYVSQSYLDQYKVKYPDIIGKHHYEVFPDLPQKWRDVHKKALAGEVSSADNDPYEREDGSVDWTRWECRPWFEADGSIGGIIVYTEVINERKQAEKKILDQLNELRRWNEVTLDREDRIIELKKEVNELLKLTGNKVRYKSVKSDGSD